MMRKLWQGLRSLRRGDSDPDWEFDERRELLRMRCHYEVEGELNGKLFPGQVVDMSLGGMKLRSFQNMAVGQVVLVTCRLEARCEQTISCKVQWVRTRENDAVTFAGLSYDESDIVLGNSWVKLVLKELGFRPDRLFQRRKYVRAECVIPAELDHQGEKVHGRLYNLGVRGALVECAQEFPSGDEIGLKVGPLERLNALELQGRVVKVTPHDTEFLVAIQFDPMGPRPMDRLGRYLRHLLLEHWVE